MECDSDMKATYFVRHGSTDGNETGAYQLHTISLSRKGLAQSAFVAERFKNFPIDVIISSDMTRAAQTADRIARAVGRIVVHSEFFQEILRPSEVRGKLKADPEVMKITEHLIRYFADDTQRHSGEENFFDKATCGCRPRFSRKAAGREYPCGDPRHEPQDAHGGHDRRREYDSRLFFEA
jgi:broad specificity phosphatase PhoE